MLRPATENDRERVLEWRNRDDVRVNMYRHEVIERTEHAEWWERILGDDSARVLICEQDGEPVGVVRFSGITEDRAAASWAFYSGYPDRRGIGTLMEREALAYAFDVLGVHRLECEVLGFNEAVIRFHEKHGFRIEGTRRAAYRRDGRWHDVVQLALLKSDYRKYVSPALSAGGLRSGQAMEFTVAVSDAIVGGFADLVGDHNPIHLDSSAAMLAGFDDRIAHGMLVGSLISGVLARDFPGPGSVYLSQTLAFERPVVVDSEVRIRLTVRAHIGRRMRLQTDIFVGSARAVTGEAELLLPRDA